MNTLFFTSFPAAMSTGIPIAIAMCVGSLIYIWLSGAIPPVAVIHRMVGGTDEVFLRWRCRSSFTPET